MVGEPALAVEDVDVRSAHGTEHTRDVLRFVDQIREAVSLLAPAPEKIFRPVVRIVGRVVGADADELHAARRVLALEREDPVLDRLHVRAVIADEHHDGAIFAANRRQVMTVPVGTGKIEGRSDGSERAGGCRERGHDSSQDRRKEYVKILSRQTGP